MKKTLLAITAISLFATGCSSISQSDFDSLKADVAAAKDASNKAYQAAQQANLNSQDAKARSMKTDEKLNRMFRKAQLK